MTIAKESGHAPQRPEPAPWDLRLGFAAKTARPLIALENLHLSRRDHLAGRCRIRIIDALKHPPLARRDQIMALPHLVRRNPEPMRKVGGGLSHAGSLVEGLALRRRQQGEKRT